ncbi:efflux RND transporter periplasmic adaptor subunit [Pseudomonas sp. KNUC1026]|uniref:efflux RND transporter periplasmic adaptor subunit n=1 Tax=Pseudomonas sp. KNUC1026 TaxID=2893890 RepID=UPI001F2BFD12|nr:efflux RND transporter periplasmic adaptor subunit [Pseudomonas sp. KNUC1026]UFH49852.1 efflux RND transporter periplasmic adaptor subunit [Pseudomonas sp. KNUC1026]
MLKTRRGWVAGVIGVAALALLGMKMHNAGPSAAGLETETLGTGDIEATVSAIGKLKPRNQVEVGARTSGQIDRILVKVGDHVERGQLLVEIDPRIPQATVDAGRAQIANLRAQIVEQQAQLQLASRQRARQQAMLKDGSTRQEDVDTALAAYQTAAARIDQLKAQVKQTQSTLSGSEAELDYTRIYAPMAGTVIALNAEAGQTLNATYQTPSVLRIADLSAMTVWTEVSEADVTKVRAGMPVYFTTLGGEGRRWASSVRQVLPAPPKPEGQTDSTPLAPTQNKVILYTALFDVDNPDGSLLPQMTAQVSFVAASAKGVLRAPLPALRPNRDKPGQYLARVLNDKGEVEVRDVRLGVHNRLDAEVLSGLAPGERLVTGESGGDGEPSRFQW